MVSPLNSEVIAPLYGPTPRDLSSVRLRSVHLDWHGPTVTLRLDLPAPPLPLPEDWAAADVDTVQGQLQFLAVENLELDAWEFLPRARRPSMNTSDGTAESGPELPALCADDVLSNSDLFYVHLDERGCSVTLGFSSVHGSQGAEFFLLFEGARDVRVRGWSAPGQRDVHVEKAADGTVEVSASSDGSWLRFRATGASLSRTRTFLAASGS